MKDYATFVMFGALCLFGCASTEPNSTVSGNDGAGMAAPPATNAGTPSTTGGTAAPATGGTPASGGAGAPAAGGAGRSSPATAAGSGGSGTATATAGSGAGGTPAAAGSGGSGTAPGNMAAPKGSFLAAYTLALRDMCMSCHAMGGIFGSPDLSSPDRAYDSLVDKDASTMAPGACGGMGKLVTPGNCETSILYSKITQMTPICGRRMPLSSDAAPQLISQEGIDAVCEWIKAGAKKDM